MKHWQPLQKGDVVDIIAPASRCSQDELESGVRFLESWGLVPRIPKNIFGRDLLCSNSREARFDHFKAALRALDSKAVWCLRGGYGALQMMPELRKMKAPRQAKLFIGFSDITTLHLHLNQAWKWPTLHGPVLGFVGRDAGKAHVRELKRLVFGEQDEIEFNSLKPWNAAARRSGRIQAPLVGGNLMVLTSSFATPSMLDARGKILFLEDVGERGYRLDRMLEQMHQAKIFDRARAVVLGEFLHEPERNGAKPGPKVMRAFFERLKIPVFSGLASGHGRVQRPVPLGTKVVLSLGARARLVCQSGGWGS